MVAAMVEVIIYIHTDDDHGNYDDNEDGSISEKESKTDK